MMSFLFWLGIGFATGILGASFFEWTLHRFVMHRQTCGFRYSFERHTLVHHHIFKADETYHLMHEPDKKTIPMAWWNGPVLLLVLLLPFLIASMFMQRWGLLCGAALSCTLYYLAYEYLHWCMHLPKQRRLEKSWIFCRLNGHHLLHHRYMQTNFNVVLPLADLLLGTLRLRAKFNFRQAQGSSVPDVQPRETKRKPTHSPDQTHSTLSGL